MHSKNLIEAQGTIEEQKKKFKFLNTQIEQLKEELNAKELG